MQALIEQAIEPIPYMDVPNISKIIMEYMKYSKLSQLFKESCDIHDVFDITYGMETEFLRMISEPLKFRGENSIKLNNELMTHFLWSVMESAAECAPILLEAISSTLTFEMMAHCGVVYRNLRAINYSENIYKSFDISREFELNDAYILIDQALRLHWIFILLRDDVAFEYLINHPKNYLEEDELYYELNLENEEEDVYFRA
jgi:hypothetical protein